ncbi:MAG TPA: MiaB/RimO family radical SAM methylthiotransferase [Candidatus Ozemobacteraceae bacterium]|nr:MiaB/RimO family radical SAM methylthiotransferase [Candidatus Ozemobacteraceae bacterium]
MKYTFLLKSLGCKVSQYDGIRIAEYLSGCGLRQAGEGETPDLYILNGCAVTGRASQKVRQALRAIRRRWPSVKLVLAGCEARLAEKRAPEEGDEPAVEIDGALPYATPPAVRELLEHLDLLRPDIPDAGDEAHVPEELIGSERTRAFLKIQDGCSQFCAYCIVPHLRGPETSRGRAELVDEARRIVATGRREIVVTGIHVGRYAHGLVALLRELSAIAGLDRIRLSSIEPVEVESDLVEWLATDPKACAHLHLPLQSGCDETLRAMRRPYDTATFAALVGRLRARMPDIGISTDLIVGFPGETDERFAATLAFVERQSFSRIHIFRYSTRDGTPAATMPGQVPNAVKQTRAKAVERLWKSSAASFHGRFVGRSVDVLWETRENGFWHGLSREYVPCRTATEADLHNVITPATVTAADPDGCVTRIDP